MKTKISNKSNLSEKVLKEFSKRNMIIELIQNSLIGKLDPSSNFNPQFLADAILEKLEFNKTYKEIKCDNINSIINSFNQMINDIDNDMNSEIEKLGDSSSDLLIKNFARGQKTACEKLKDSLNKL